MTNYWEPYGNIQRKEKEEKEGGIFIKFGYIKN
jgi:hypothetical protein